MAFDTRTGGGGGGGGALMEYIRRPRAKYTIVGEAIRHVIPAHVQCSIGCGGQACKYDNPGHWSVDQQAIKGLYSSWVTDNLLAMSRPSTEIIEKYDIIDQFRRNGIKSVMNLQMPGEHASCGNPLEAESGFSYRPEVFMANDVYFYNFGWSDYGVASLAAVLDMVKVVAFALQEGKVAVHCHAGLGRTGVLLACFLAYATRMTANQAIAYVRAKRPDSIQTRSQLRCVRQFVQFLGPLRSVFSRAEPRRDAVTLSQYLDRQGRVLHGGERRELRHTPKIVRLVSRLLLDIVENREVIEEDVLEAPDAQDIEATLGIVERMGPEFFAGGPRLPGSPTLPRHFNEPPIFYHRKSLSYSESDLSRLGSQLNLLASPLGALSQGDVRAAAAPPPEPASVVSQGSTGSLWKTKNEKRRDDAGSLLLEKIQRRALRRSGSTGTDGPDQEGGALSWWRAEKKRGGGRSARNGTTRPDCGDEQSEKSEVPFITLQSELSLDARRLLVAQALAVDLFLDGEEEHKAKVLAWQAELNHGGGWERLCAERDPFVLAGLMWAWLEQLKEPAVSVGDARALDPDGGGDARAALDALGQAPRETLTCILDCMARMRRIPAEVENAFLNRAVKAFTWMEADPGDGGGGGARGAMAAVLRRVLDDARRALTGAEEEETPAAPFPLS